MSILQLGLKFAISAGIAVAVAEIAKRSNFWAAALASLPLTSVLAFMWLYLDTGEPERIAALSTSIFWLVLPSLVFFVVLPILLRAQWGFAQSMLTAAAATAVAYVGVLKVLSIAGVKT